MTANDRSGEMVRAAQTDGNAWTIARYRRRDVCLGIGATTALGAYGFGVPNLTASALAAAIDATFDIYIDSRDGNDKNDGRHPRRALRSLGALGALKDGTKIGLRRGSAFLGGIVAPDARGIMVGAYGDASRPRPFIGGALPIANSAFTKTIGRKNIYQVNLPIAAPRGAPVFIRPYDSGTMFTGHQWKGDLRAKLAYVETRPDSFAFEHLPDGSGVLYLHTRDGTAPTTNKRAYTATTAIPVMLGDHARVSDIDTADSVHNDGSIKVGDYSVVDGCRMLRGGKHNGIGGWGCLFHNCEFEETYYPEGVPSPLVLFHLKGTPTLAGAPDTWIVNCRFSITKASAPFKFCSFIIHHTETGFLGKTIIRGCSFSSDGTYNINAVTGADHGATLILDSRATNMTSIVDVGGYRSPRCDVLVDGLSARQTKDVPGNKFMIATPRVSGSLTVRNCRLCTYGPTAGPFILLVAKQSMVTTIENNLFFVGHASANYQGKVFADYGNTKARHVIHFLRNHVSVANKRAIGAVMALSKGYALGKIDHNHYTPASGRGFTVNGKSASMGLTENGAEWRAWSRADKHSSWSDGDASAACRQTA